MLNWDRRFSRIAIERMLQRCRALRVFCGWLEGKTYADGSGYSYTYNPQGWLLIREDAKSAITGYEYSNVGQYFPAGQIMEEARALCKLGDGQ